MRAKSASSPDKARSLTPSKGTYTSSASLTYPKPPYPDNYSTVQIYSCHRFIGSGNLGPLTTFALGEELTMNEDRCLFTGVKWVRTEEEISNTPQNLIFWP